MMGGMGRSFDGGYPEFTCVPVARAIPFRSELPWTTLGAVPEMLQTSYGALTVGLDVQPHQTLLIRGGTSSVGSTAAILAKRRGQTVLATTRSEAKAATASRLRAP
jgi:NADPH2:quinone reductase